MAVRPGRFAIEHGGTFTNVDVAGDGSVRVAGIDSAFEVRAVEPRVYEVRQGDRPAQIVYVTGPPDRRWAFSHGRACLVSMATPSVPRAGGAARPELERLTSPMPATVIKVLVAAGDEVREGDGVVILEAMKMELPVRSTRTGRVEHIWCREGDLVQGGALLAEVR